MSKLSFRPMCYFSSTPLVYMSAHDPACRLSYIETVQSRPHIQSHLMLFFYLYGCLRNTRLVLIHYSSIRTISPIPVKVLDLLTLIIVSEE
jgi:hypothetical protein